MSQTDTKATHTPGPWRYEYGQVYATKQAPREPGATVEVSIGGADRDDDFTTPTERDANVRLMAAAPEMYDALRLIVGWWEDTSGAVEDVRMDDYVAMARAALVKGG